MINELTSDSLKYAYPYGRKGEIRVGLRPLCRDSLPIIGAVPGVSGLFVATGHGASGLQLGPYSGMITADLALGGKAPKEAGAFNPDRFLK